MLADPEFAAELDDLKKDAPPGQGPFLSDMSHLRRDPKPSERQEAGVAALATNPVPREVPDVPGTKVVLNAPPVENPEAQQARRLQVTQPDIKKKEQLGIPEDLEFGGRALAGTLKFKNPVVPAATEPVPPVPVTPTSAPDLIPEPGPPPVVEPIAEEPLVPGHKRPWLWIGVILVALGAAAAAAFVLARGDDFAATQSTERRPSVTPTSIATTSPPSKLTAEATATAITTPSSSQQTNSATAIPISTTGTSAVTADSAPPAKSSAQTRPSSVPAAPTTATEATTAPPALSTSSHPVPPPAASSSGRGLIYDFQKRKKADP